MRLRILLHAASTGILVTAFAATAQAQIEVAVDRGWYNDLGSHNPFNTNFIVGADDFGLSYRNFFVFDLSSIVDDITSATLHLDLVTGAANPFESPDGTEDYELFDVSTSVISLLAGTGGVAAYNDLGSGTSYGGITITADDKRTTLSIALNADALAAMNAATAEFAIGGAITTIDGLLNEEFAFAGSHTLPMSASRLEIVTGPSECFLVVGNVPGASDHLAGDHVFQTQLESVEATFPVLMEDGPAFVLPVQEQGPGLTPGFGVRDVGPSISAETPAWLLDGIAVVQVVMWNPSVFPQLPEQSSVGLVVEVLPDGQVLSTPFGTAVGGIGLSAEVKTNAQGQQVLTFPFTIDGL